jgi:LCP family protein required for cell wall assembly
MRGTSWVAVILVILLGSVVGIASGTFLAVYMPAIMEHGGVGQVWTEVFGGKEQVRILMIGEDDTAKRNSNGHGLSDTLVVMAINTRTKEIRGISIPRDTRVEIPNHGVCKINSAHVYGGPELTKQVVQNLLGVPIDYYIKTNTRGLRGMVDLVGGVYIKIDKDMHYVDRRGGLYINLKAGPEKQLLNGRQAEGYVRFRHDRIGDSGYEIINGKKVAAGRTARQQIFMRALANRILSMPSKRDRIRFLQTAYERGYIESNLTLKDWDALADYFKDIKPEEIAMDVLPGAPGNIGGVSYWLVDYDEAARVIATNMRFEDSASVEVLNGSGVAGVAARVAERLRQAGFEVTRTDNADSSDYKHSCIIAHRKKTEPAERIARLLNCDRDSITYDVNSKGDADITVIVGKNYSELTSAE